ncbi:MAG: tetratricopeptide repeat protein [Candidatus Muiribacteriota bacterium]
MKQKNIMVLLILLFSVLIFSNIERKAQREKSFIVELYREGFHQEVLDELADFEETYQQFMDEDLYLIAAESHYNLQNFDKAISYYKECIEITDKYKEYATYSLAHTFLEENQFVNALKYFLMLAEEEGEYQEKSILSAARIYNKMQQAQEAKKYYEKYIDLFESPQVSAIIEYADVTFDLNKKNEAMEIIEDFLEKDSDILLLQKLAEFKRRTDNYDEAIELYSKLTELTGSNEYDYFNGIIHFNQSEFEKAAEYFSKVVDNPEYGERSLFYKAQSIYLMMDFEQSIEYFKKLFQAENEEIRQKSYFYTASAYKHLDEYDKALELLTKEDFDSEDFLELKRDIYISMGDYMKAVEEIRKLLRKNINEANNYFLAGQCYFNLQNFERAAQNLILARDRAETSRIRNNAIFELANVYEVEDKKEKALEELKKIPQDSRLFRESRFKLIDIYRGQKEFDMVFQVLDELKETKDEGSYINFIKGEIYYEVGDHDKARTELKKIKKDSDHYQPAIKLRAEIFHENNNFEEAYNLISKNLDDVSEAYEVDYIYILSKSAFELKKYDEVISKIENIRDSREDNFKLKDEIRFILAQAYLKIKNLSQARANALYVAEESDDRNLQIKAQFFLGEVYFEFEEYRQAVLEYLKSALLDRNSKYAPEAYYMAARCYEKLGRDEDAQKTYEKIIENYPDSEWAQKSR